LYQFRTFRNTDPPRLAAIWNRQPRLRGLARHVSAELLEHYVYSRANFVPAGLIVATHDGVPVGFAHAGFGPSENERQLSHELGVVSMLMVDPAHDGPPGEPRRLADDLLTRGEMYLRQAGATVLYAGGIRPLDPFYLGLYGGSELPGILASDKRALTLYEQHEYEPIDRVCVLQLDLDDFRPKVSRRQVQLRRTKLVQVVYDPPTTTWWEAVTRGNMQRRRFELFESSGSTPLASVTYWHLEQLEETWAARAMGMLELTVDVKHRGYGLATYLLDESFRRLNAEGIKLIEAQTMIQNLPAQALYRSLGFQQVDEGVVLRKKSTLV